MNDDQEVDDGQKDSVEHNVKLFKRGFELTDSISPGEYPSKGTKARRCRSCHRPFVPLFERDGQHVCPSCHGTQRA